MTFQENLAAPARHFHASQRPGVCAMKQAALSTTFPPRPASSARFKLYHALAAEFNGRLNAAAAERGLALFAEHVADAAAPSGQTSEYRFIGAGEK